MSETPNSRAESWPEMAATEWGEDDFAIEGTYPTSIVRLGIWGAHNEPMPTVESAACAYCDRWAVEVCTGVRTTADGPFLKPIHRRMELTLIYVCNFHRKDAENELLDTRDYGSCGNTFSDQLELALKVESRDRPEPRGSLIH